MEKLEIEELNAKDHKQLTFIENLYIESFPLSERRPVEKMLELYIENPLFNILLAKNDNEYIGFFTYWDISDFIFAEHFAIRPELRNQGLGKEMMTFFLKNTTKPIVLEVELPTTILSERRIGFYQRIGFKLWENIQYQQPSYHQDDTSIPMKLMSYGNINIENDLSTIRNTIYENVYH